MLSEVMGDSPPSEMDGDELIDEYESVKENLNATNVESVLNEAHMRLESLWYEIIERYDGELPSCDRCGTQRWVDDHGGFYGCASCGAEPVDAFMRKALKDSVEEMKEAVSQSSS